MNILFLRRKRTGDIGGLSRFVTELVSGFSPTVYTTSIDLIHATDATLLPLGVALKTILRSPLTVTAHGKDITWPNPIYQQIFSYCTPFVNKWIVDSPAAARLLTRTSVTVIPPGISTDHFKKYSVPVHPVTDTIILATVGNLVPRKGHAWFIEHVLAKLPARFIYYIVGDGSERRHIQNVVSQLCLGNRVILCGRITDTELAHMFTKINVYVAPNRHTSGDFEGFGIAAGEAAAMGIPVLASRVDGLPGVIHHNKNGWLVTPTPKAWMQAIRSMPRPIGNAHKYTLSHFSWEKTINQYSRLFQEVAGKTLLSQKRFLST